MLLECGLSKNFLVAIRPESSPGIANVVKLADYFDVSLDYLIGRTDNIDFCKNHISEKKQQLIYDLLSVPEENLDYVEFALSKAKAMPTESKSSVLDE